MPDDRDDPFTLGAISERVRQHRERLDEHDRRFAALGAQLETVHEQLATIDRKQEAQRAASETAQHTLSGIQLSQEQILAQVRPIVAREDHASEQRAQMRKLMRSLPAGLTILTGSSASVLISHYNTTAGNIVSPIAGIVVLLAVLYAVYLAFRGP